MNKNVENRKGIIEEALLKSMKYLDEALVQIVVLNTDDDNYNYNKLSQCKSQIKKVLNISYDKLARERKK